ncbi:xanthine dehydrogenase molybdenum-binding subunit XdhA [Clostridium sp. AF18-27]|uniref:Xanthine dehydrogenase molybdenum-binding subunit n=2 Tax=Enterocloster TaxID=2719313 RepID=A0A1I0JLP8_9FIRM|nr:MULTISPECIES: xanthine dehydrogenase subunit XdhA [Enterocloster]MBS5606843.1 molybdopterin-dependent oxidoreductase [Enterocloster asparagiformis]RHR55111.1 xanthine dehydrogenase molybdenum-binding subunit XdhA [Clostridium sp. AF18-27]MDR3757870.1 molybdopterin-dependent oxidoreductase [Enterocloster sp.]PST33722.1 xanthine dehydrogenase molybdenum-binding subunit XdhA [Enterocloster lavalensis]SEU11338.1 xanthine dehydrogenase molybdenum-binding subunit [Enterocloster lavalensis]
MKIVGQELKRVDAYGKVTGEAKYTADLEPRDILHGKVVHATIANGRVKSFDLTEAMKVPGVVKIVTCFDAPDCQFPTAGHPWSVESKHQDICDRRVLNERVRLYGDDIAAVVAENEVAAAQAARLIKVEYEEYEPIVTVEAAMAEGATPLHPDLRKDNVIVHSHMTMGDSDFTFDKGILAAREMYPGEELIAVEEEYDTPRISHCHIELPVSWAYVDTNGKVTVVCSTQIPHIVRRCTAQALGIPVGQVRIIKPYIGGGFGNKQDVLYEPLNAFLSMSVGGRPVRLEISREETISGTRTRHAIKGKCKGLMTKDGRILARKIDAFANNGAYASHGHAICANCGNVFKDLYRDELGCEVDCWTVYTSSPTAGAMRGYGIPQAVWFAECLTDDLADRIGMDPCEFRLKNCMEEGFVDPANGITFHSYGLKRCIEEGKSYIRWDEKWKQYRNQTGPVRKGVGMAIFCYKTGVHPISLETSSARMVLNQDGSMQLCMGATEIGQGADTVFSQMASETTGISFDKVYIVSTQDTDTTPFDTGAYASRQTYVSGMACKKCGEEFRGKILEYAAYMLNHDLTDLSKTVYADQVKEAAGRLREALGLGADEDVTAEMLDIVDSKVVVSGGDPVLFDVAVVADTAFYSLDRSVHITAEVTNHCKDNTFSSGCCFVEVEVDMPLGLVTVKDIVNVHDSGVLINPKTAAAQVHGGMSMGLGYGLSEELLVDEKTGKTLNNNLLDYKIPTAMDTPELNVRFIQLDDPTGPYGNKSLGEPPAIPVAPAIRNAILNATGVHMNMTPMTAQRLIAKFKEKGLI